VRELVEFRRLNLIEPVDSMNPFPLIFCRNVMIYFDKPTQDGVVKRLSERLEPGGWLMVGHAESLAGVNHGLGYVRPAVYQKPRTEPQKPRRDPGHKPRTTPGSRPQGGSAR
jgi:chemotaxis protein methyltransferase CheR